MLLPPPNSTLFPYTTLFFFFFNDTATTEIYTLSLHDALPIWLSADAGLHGRHPGGALPDDSHRGQDPDPVRSEEHTSELQSHSDLVCRLLLEIRRAHV